MLWWLILWLASGLLVPALFLIGMARRWLTPVVAPALATWVTRLPWLSPGTWTGRYVLCGLAGIGVLTLLYAGTRSNSLTATQGLSSSAIVAEAPVKPTPADAAGQAELARVVLAEPSPHGAKPMPSTDPQPGVPSDPSGPIAAAPLAPPLAPEAAPADVPVEVKVPEERSLGHRGARRSPVAPYRTTVRLNHGIWVFPPNQHGGNG